MELTKFERLTLINQYKILEKLYPNEEEAYQELRIPLEEGFTYDYYKSFSFMESELSIEQCKEVLNILDMYRTLTFSYRDLEDKSGIDMKDIKFHGFDGNNEPSQYVYAKHYLITLNRYQELKDGEYDDFNSHRGMLSKYRRMLTVFQSLSDRYNLNKEQIISVINA
ncbi:YfbU family protein [Guptibacillus hwajinpoensis]|uniref:YfbU family protein n=1 Tax=Guptibacillus hwajinpoensis TaxID=208199 RepID=UPI00373541E6